VITLLVLLYPLLRSLLGGLVRRSRHDVDASR
jgi:hypothetical protein